MLDISHLNEQQKQAVCHSGSPLLILAGAGTGKTTVITHHIARLLEQGVRPEEIAALTFTEKAAQEMIDRVEHLVDVAYMDMHVSTFHAFCQWLLSNYGLDIGLSDRFNVLTGHAAWMLVHDNFDRFELDYYKPRGNPYRFIHAMIQHFGRAKDEHITPEQYLAYAQDVRLNADNIEYEEEGKRLHEIAGAYHTYNQLLLEHEVLDFGDLLVYSLQLLQRRPQILAAMRDRFKYILVDEFQDTNWIQYELVKLLSGNGLGLRVVADDDQSIYKFRGASVANVMQFLKDYPDAARVSLTTNYRSGQRILDCSYQFIQHNNPERLEVKEGLDKKLVSDKPEKGNTIARFFKTQAQEDAFIIEEIRSRDMKGCAVLCRTNAQAQHMTDVLGRAGISVYYHARGGLFKDPMIMDCMAWLSLLVDPNDNVSCYRVFNNMRAPCPAVDVAVITHCADQKQWSYVYTCRHIGKSSLSEEGSRWLTDFLQRLDAHQKVMQETSVSGMAHLFFEEFGWFGYMTALGSGDRGSDAMRLVGVLQSFLDELQVFEETRDEVFVHDFMRYARVLSDAGYEGAVSESNVEVAHGVHVMTIHASKGLEFDCVFIPQLVQRRFPSDKRRETIEMPGDLIKEKLPEGDVHMQEERRLMYVACTRARDVLYLTYAEDYGGKRAKKPSQFVGEMPLTFEEGVVMPSTDRVEKPHVQTDVPRRFSFTSLQSFGACPLQYKLDHIIKIPTKGAAALSFGESIHRTLERFYTRMRDMNRSQQASLFDDDSAPTSGLLRVPTRDELLELYTSSFVEDWYASAHQKEEYRARGLAMMREYYDRHTTWTMPRYIEQHVAFSLRDVMISGAIDRVDEENGDVIIIDYKTGTPKSEESLKKEHKLQLLIYVMGLEATCGVRASRCEFWYLEDGSKVVFEPTDEDIEQARQEVLDRIGAISKSDFSPTPSQFTCGSCKFRDACEFRA